MITLPFVSSSVRMNSLSYAIKIRAPYIVERFWAMVKKSSELDNALHTSTNGEDIQREEADAVLYKAMLALAYDMLPADVMADVTYEVAQYVTHCEVAQASMLEPDEEAAIWDAWDHMDAAAEEQVSYDAWRNEY